MRYYKHTSNGYIVSIGTGNGGAEITESEYNTILSVIANKPVATETTDFMLRDDLTWEEYEVEIPPEDEGTAEDVLSMLEEAL